MLAQAVKTCPTDPDARRFYADSLWRQGRHVQAIAQLEEACRLLPEEASVRVDLANMYLTVGRFDRAGDCVQQAIDLDPKSDAAWATRGRVGAAETARLQGQEREARLRQALADYHRALVYRPNDPRVLFEIAELYRQMGNPQRALETLQALADTYSPGEEPQPVLYFMGLACMALERYDDAAEQLSAAAARRKPAPEIAAADVPNEEILGRLAEARRQAEVVAQRAPLIRR